LICPPCSLHRPRSHRSLPSFPTRRSSDLDTIYDPFTAAASAGLMAFFVAGYNGIEGNSAYPGYRYPMTRADLRVPPTKYGEFLRSEEHTSELQSPYDLVCRLLLEKKKKKK